MPSYDLKLHRNRDNESPEEQARRRDRAIEVAAQLQNNKDALDNMELKRQYVNSQDRWANEAAENERYIHNVMFTKEQMDILAERNQAAIPINAIYPAVEQGVAMMTTHAPAFRAVAREDSDVKTAKAMSDLLTWAWDQTNGNEHLKQAIYDYYVIGRGCLQVYVDPSRDMGKGDICITSLNPLEVYPDPNSKDRLWRDAAHVLTCRYMTREQIERLWPDAEAILDTARESMETSVMFTSDRVASSGQVFVEDITDEYHDRYEVIERYTKVSIRFMRIFEAFSGREDLLLEEEVEEYFAQEAMIVSQDDQQVVVTGKELEPWLDRFAQGDISEDGRTSILELPDAQDPQTGQIIPQPPLVMEHVTFRDLLDMGAIDVADVTQPRIMLVISIGDLLYRKTYLPIEDYPIIPFNNRHIRTPYPMSDVQFVKPIQDALNRTQALMIASMGSSSNPKVLVPRGSIDKEQLEESLAKAGPAILEYDAEFGAPTVVAPTPLSEGYFRQFQVLMEMIQREMGIHDLMMGDSGAAPQTHKGTIAIEQFGQRRIRSKLDDIEAAIKHTAKVMVPLMQKIYREEKVIRILQPNNMMQETTLNGIEYDDLGDVARVVNDISVGRYDTIIVAGSTLPSNRFALLDYYRELYQEGIIDQFEVLKKTDVVDAEGVMERSSIQAQLQQALAAAQEEIKNLKGDLQTQQREKMHAMEQLQLEKFKSRLEEPLQAVKKTEQLYKERSADVLRMEQMEAKASKGATNG